MLLAMRRFQIITDAVKPASWEIYRKGVAIEMVVDLQESRKKIDEIDMEIVRLFQKRMDVAADVAAYKRSTGKKVFDAKREEDKIASLKDMAEGEFYKMGVEELFRQIMSISRKYQYQQLGPAVNEIPFREVEELDVDEDTRVVCFGEHGAFTEQAMEEIFGKKITTFNKQSFREVMEAVADGDALFGVLPIENSTTGAVSGINELLMEYDVTIIAEHFVKVEQSLLGLPGAKMEDLRTVYSHAQGLMQCSKFLESQKGIATKTYASTAGAAKKVKEEGDQTQGAIASKRAAETFGLHVLRENINDEDNNYTRFIVITNQKIFLSDANKLSLCFEVKHQAGSLYHFLSNFYYNDLNLTKIESCPIENKNWEYRFFVDVEGNVNSPGVGNALASMRECANNVTVLGNVAER